jgi:dTDP-4-amino-4,6-dideoxygalactose transaminase
MATGGAAARHELEGFIRAQWGPDQFVPTDSGTSALALALELAEGVGRLPVALPAYGCYDLATAVDTAGVPFVLYDVDPVTLGPDFVSLRSAVLAGARTVVAVHLFGIPADLDAIRRVAGPDAIIIEDAAQGVGAQKGGRQAGALGDLGVLSFGRGKGMTGGSGGVLMLNRSDLAARFRGVAAGIPYGKRGSAAEVAKLAAQWALARPWLYSLPASVPWLGLGDTVYRAPHPIGEITAFAAGVVGETLRSIRREAAARRRNAQALLRVLESIPGLSAAGRVPTGWDAGWLRFPALADAGMRARLPDLRRHGVLPGYPLPLTRLQGFGERNPAASMRYPGAERLAAGLVTLPTHSWVTPKDLERLVAALK